jgi:hypothetical protein
LSSDDNHDASSADNDVNHDASSADNDDNDDVNDDGNAPYDVNHNVNNDGNAHAHDDVNHAGSRLTSNCPRAPRCPLAEQDSQFLFARG